MSEEDAIGVAEIAADVVVYDVSPPVTVKVLEAPSGIREMEVALRCSIACRSGRSMVRVALISTFREFSKRRNVFDR
jgi:hypothetical protein